MKEVISNFIFNPFFGIVLSLTTYLIGKYFFYKTKSVLCTPLLIGIILSIIFLMTLKIPYEAYDKGGSILKLLISPIQSLIIGVALYEQVKILKKNFFPIMLSTFFGSSFAIIVVYFLGKLIKVSPDMIYASLPKSATIAIGLDIGSKFGWDASLIAVMTVITGVTGAVIAPLVTKFIKYPVSKGLGIGTASHAVGTAKAIEMGEVEGAMSGLSLSLTAIFTSLVVPFFILYIK